MMDIKTVFNSCALEKRVLKTIKFEKKRYREEIYGVRDRKKRCLC